MKNVNLLQLIASLCMLFGCVINLIALITEIPPWLSVCALPLLLVAVVLYFVTFLKARRQGKSEKNERK